MNVVVVCCVDVLFLRYNNWLLSNVCDAPMRFSLKFRSDGDPHPLLSLSFFAEMPKKPDASPPRKKSKRKRTKSASGSAAPAAQDEQQDSLSSCVFVRVRFVGAIHVLHDR